jgi:predicted DNA-binding antitoxin AbrB/MazE fold protein
MGKVIEAVYEKGVFKPLEKVNLKDGEKVKIRVSNVVKRTRGILDRNIIEEVIDEIEGEGIL